MNPCGAFTFMQHKDQLLSWDVFADKPMQLNQALFMLGGSSGYVPQPDIMRDDAFDPFDKDTLHVEPITIQLQVTLDSK